MEHHFDVDVAKQYGVEEAVLVYNLVYWIKKNKANDKNYYDGYYWTYNSARAFEELLPYFNSKKISRLLKKLEVAGVIKTGNYNKVPYDQTKWYAILNEELLERYDLKRVDNVGNTISQKCPMEDTKMGNTNDKSVQPIPNNKPNSKTDKKTYVTSETEKVKEKVQQYRQVIAELIRTGGLNTTVDQVIREAGRNKIELEEVVNRVKAAIKSNAENKTGLLIGSLKNNYEIKTKADKKEFEFDKKRYEYLKAEGEEFLTGKDLEYLKQCKEYLEG